MKRAIDRDEWWPVYSLDPPYEHNSFEVPDELCHRYKAAVDEFNAVQDVLEAIYAARKAGAS